MLFKVKFRREFELELEVEAETEHRAEIAAEAILAKTLTQPWEEINTTIEEVECLDPDEDEEYSDDE